MSLDRRFQAFHDLRNGLLDEMESLDPGALRARPLSGKWSIIEIIEHLVLAERSVFKGLPAPDQLTDHRRGFGHHVRFGLVMLVLTYGIRVRVPSRAMVPQGNRTLAELRHMWDENHDWLRGCIEYLGPDGGRKAVFEHPVAGPLTLDQAVRMGRVHVDGHIRQIRALQRLLS